MKKAVNPVLQNDIQRYKKNKLASSLALLGIVFACVYFMFLYAQVKTKPEDFYYKWPLAIDVLYNLVFMLVIFLCSEQVKNYDRRMFYFQIALGVMQFVRIFWLPLAGITETAYVKLVGIEFSGISGYKPVLSTGTFAILLVGLAGSGACVIASAVIGYIRSKSLENFNKKLESGEISVETTLKELDEADARSAAETPVPETVEEAPNA